AGIKKVLIPRSNLNDVLIEDKYVDKIEIIPVETLTDVIKNALTGPGKEELLKKLKEMRPPKITGKVELESEKKLTGHRDFTGERHIDRSLFKSQLEEK
ncbi:MAG: ATP-dependent protease LonB, partial [Thermoplasmatales archaeon]|nr:ATP-dependent protease LonB [Thermoplasmatales archaeon]